MAPLHSVSQTAGKLRAPVSGTMNSSAASSRRQARSRGRQRRVERGERIRREPVECRADQLALVAEVVRDHADAEAAGLARRGAPSRASAPSRWITSTTSAAMSARRRSWSTCFGIAFPAGRATLRPGFHFKHNKCYISTRPGSRGHGDPHGDPVERPERHSSCRPRQPPGSAPRGAQPARPRQAAVHPPPHPERRTAEQRSGRDHRGERRDDPRGNRHRIPPRRRIAAPVA